MDAAAIDTRAIELAADRLLAGELVAFPTETVYGLGADACNRDAIGRIYAAKGRPADHPVIVHVAPGAELGFWAGEVPPQARQLIDAFWPGPLSLILKRAPSIPDAVSGGQDSIGIRCPSHPVAQALLRAFASRCPGGQGGVAAPSANKFGQVSPTRAEHVRVEFPEQVAAGMPVLDGGSSEVGIESTILDLSRLGTGIGPVLLRPGRITAAQIEAVLGTAVQLPDAAAPRASGTLKAHYAPRTPLSWVGHDALEQLVQGPALAERTVVLGWQATPARLPRGLDWRQVAANPEAFAQALYASLRELDLLGYRRILVQALPRDPAWEAVGDRLARAAAAFPGAELP